MNQTKSITSVIHDAVLQQISASGLGEAIAQSLFEFFDDNRDKGIRVSAGTSGIHIYVGDEYIATVGWSEVEADDTDEDPPEEAIARIEELKALWQYRPWLKPKPGGS